MTDLGLLGAMVNTDTAHVLVKANIFGEFEGGLAEQYVLQQMVSKGYLPYTIIQQMIFVWKAIFINKHTIVLRVVTPRLRIAVICLPWGIVQLRRKTCRERTFRLQ
jgi:hypothetical protein